MAPSIRYQCNSCGHIEAKWIGKCPSCKEWNTLTAFEAAPRAPGVRRGRANRSALNLVPLRGETPPLDRFATGIGELDRVLGGGCVPGAVILIAGDPGIGKSTLLMQAAAALATKGISTVYVSAEENIDQVRRRADRLGLADAPVQLDNTSDVQAVVECMFSVDKPQIMVVDSIQTMRSSEIDSAPGTVSQVRHCTDMLVTAAKATHVTVILVGHVTKQGAMAGPQTLNHLVDATIMFDEGDRNQEFRILRAEKNRFGATDEIGVFMMREHGLEEVPNPSEHFLADRRVDVPGSAVYAGIEGTRPLLVEIQALSVPNPTGGSSRRTVIGYDSNRVSMIVAVLEARAGVGLMANDLFLTVAGGLKISDPAADVAVAAAILSSVLSAPIPGCHAFFGEIGLSGEIRGAARFEARQKEAEKMGFSHIHIPKRLASNARGSNLVALSSIEDIVFSIAQHSRLDDT